MMNLKSSQKGCVNLIKYKEDYNPILEYYDLIKKNKVTVSKKIRFFYAYLVDEIKNPKEFHYEPARANHVIEFAENFCHLSKGSTELVKLELWEKAHLAAVFGFVDKDGNRQCRESVLIVGKKNGKSLLASIVGLYMLLCDGEPGPEVYSVATKKDQAKIIWMEAKRMVSKSPMLKKRTKPLVGELSSEAFNNGTFKPLASDSDTLDGLNVHCVLMDEIHQWKDGKRLYDIMADGVAARTQSLVYITSTAGTVREDIYDIKYNEAVLQINSLFSKETYTDPHFFPFIYELDERSEWVKEKCWYKANPGLGTIKNLQTLRDNVKKAIENPDLVKNLVCKQFNIRETSSEAWMNWTDINNETTYDIKELKPRYGIGGFDLSTTTDLTNATVIFKVPDDQNIYVKQMYWIPEDLLEERVAADKVPYDKWRDNGWLRTCPGNRIRYQDIVDWFLEVQEVDDIYLYKCGYDSWSAAYMVEEMKATFGEFVPEPIIQGKKTLSAPMKALKAELIAKHVIYDNNPILKWCISNTSVDIDKNDNIQPSKGRQQNKRIDGLAGLLDAYTCYENNLEEYLSVL